MGEQESWRRPAGKMNFTETVKDICVKAAIPITPQEIREQIKIKYPEHYRTPSHLRNVAKGHYKDADHALLSQIYTLIYSNRNFVCDKTQKPLKVTWQGQAALTRDVVLPSRPKEYYPPASAGYGGRIADILGHLAEYHSNFYQAAIFSGPSLYFHRRAIETRGYPPTPIHIEYIYATLTSWGMHRMGKRGAKMHDFGVFKDSIMDLSGAISLAGGYEFQALDEEQWVVLGNIFTHLKVMATDTHLVGNSKTMHHLLPHLMPPIDREYTLWYLRGNTNIRNDDEWEWTLLKQFVQKFFAPVVADPGFHEKAARWLSSQDEFPWDTSPMKIIDNLIIGAKAGRGSFDEALERGKDIP